MAIYLMQHGAAKAETEDPQRSLAGAGRRTVERVGEHLAKCRVTLGLIEHSDKLRARQTAEILVAKLHPANATEQVVDLAPNEDVEPTRVRLDHQTENVMLVGHLPHLRRLVSRPFVLQADHILVEFQMGKLERDATGRRGASLDVHPRPAPP